MKKLLMLLLLVVMGFAYQYYRLPNVIKRVRSSVVLVKVQCVSGQRIFGSGVVIGDRLILTAGHIIEDANNVCVISDDGVKTKSSEFFRLKTIDIGLIIVEKNGGSALSFGHDVNIGSAIFTIGSPFNHDNKNSVVVGVLSAYDRHMFGERLYQLDLVINPGMSGCPVFNRYGNIIGIVTRGRHGLGYMVPVETCQFVVDIYENVEKIKTK